MKKSQNKNAATKTKVPLRRQKRFWIFCVAAVIILAGATTYGVSRHNSQQKVAAERARFEQAYDDIKLVFESSAQSNGNPIKVLNGNECKRPNVEFAEAPLSCSAEQTMIYDATNALVANRLFNQIVSDTEKYFGKIMPVDSANSIRNFNDDNDESSQVIYSKLKNSPKNLTCRLTTNYYNNANPPFDDYRVEASPGKKIAASISCTGLALDKYFSGEQN